MMAKIVPSTPSKSWCNLVGTFFLQRAFRKFRFQFCLLVPEFSFFQTLRTGSPSSTILTAVYRPLLLRCLFSPLSFLREGPYHHQGVLFLMIVLESPWPQFTPFFHSKSFFCRRPLERNPLFSLRDPHSMFRAS